VVSPDDRVPTDAVEEGLDAGQVRQRAARGVVTLSLRGLLTRLLALGANVVLARLLLPSDFGALAFGFTIVAFAGVLSSGGLGAALVRHKETPTRRDLQSLFGFQLLVMSGAAALVAVVGAFSGRAGALAAIMALSLPLDAVRVPSALMAERVLAFGVIARAEVSEIAAYSVAAIAAVAAGWGVWGVAGATIVRALVGSTVLVRGGSVGLIAPRLSASFLRATARLGVAFQSMSIVYLLRDQGFNVIVGAFGGLSMLGYWTLASRLAQAIVLLFDSLWRVTYPAMARLIDIDADPAGALERGLRLATVAAGAIVAVLAGSSPALVPALFGERWHESIAILPCACLGVLIEGPLSACATGYLSAIDRVGTVLRASGLQTAVLFLTGVPLLNAYGTFGLGLSWLVGSLAAAIVLGLAVRRSAGIDVVPAMAGAVASACAAGSASYVVATLVQPATVGFAASASVAVAGYLALTSVLCRTDLLTMLRVARGAVRPSPDTSHGVRV
jgi:O-antigen/teichoic acid export membrane protein